MDSREFSEWIAYNVVDPFVEERADFRNAMLTSCVMNMFGGKTKPKDFMPTYGKKPGIRDEAGMRRYFQTLASIGAQENG